jgi:hypothetical protein
MGLLADAAAALACSLAGGEGAAVEYSRGTVKLMVVAWRSRTDLQVATADGLVTDFESWDWHLAAVDLADVFGDPQAGDRIRDAGGLYEVMEVPGGRPWRDVQGVLRIHTKGVA